MESSYPKVEYKPIYPEHGSYPVGYQVYVDGFHLGNIDKSPGDWVFTPDEAWLSPDELIAVGESLKRFKPND